MPTLKQLINRYLYTISFILVFLSLMVVSIIQLKIEHDRAYTEGLRSLVQIEQIMLKNQQELEIAQAEYRKTCLLNAKVVSRLIESSPDLLYNLEELRNIASHLEIDEIHFFDTSGKIFSGTHPEYYNYTFDSGEQIGFFKPLLTDKTLELVQSITPNTAEEKLMQYSALWSRNQEYIIQIGMKPVNVEKATAKNELSYIFSLFRVNPNIHYFAIDSQSGKIVGASKEENVNLDCSEVGFSFMDIQNDETEIYANINGKESYCIFKKIGSTYVAYVIQLQHLYQELPIVICILFLCMMLIAITLATSFNEYMKTNIVNKLHKINELLSSITEGNLNQIVDVRNVYELSELSTHINTMVQSLFSSNSKLTYILSRTNIYLGTYEYSYTSNYIKFSEYIPTLFSWDEDTINLLSTSRDDFKNYIDSVRTNPVPYEQNVYEINDKYIKIDEILENDYILGVAMDVTDNIKKNNKLVQEIHLDTLTGLYNHKGIEIKLDALFSSPETLGYYAMIIIRADGLIKINATYGADNGDIYLKKIANIITDFGIKNSVAARQWGGEFILFLYGYDNEKEVSKAIDLLTYIQNHTITHLDNNIDVPIDFSFVYSISNGLEKSDYHTLIKDVSDSKYSATISNF
ncbi:MAG: diguanylate cyclase [Lachnospiraceae bacterium]|nr:diguanylate cyclase [Lachnospiraceae bacterium]